MRERQVNIPLARNNDLPYDVFTLADVDPILPAEFHPFRGRFSLNDYHGGRE